MIKLNITLAGGGKKTASYLPWFIDFKTNKITIIIVREYTINPVTAIY